MKSNRMEETRVIRLMAREFLEEKLGIPATENNVRDFSDKIAQFEESLSHATTKYSTQEKPE